MIGQLFHRRRVTRSNFRRKFVPCFETLEDRAVPATTGISTGVFDPSSATWYLRSSADAGSADAGKFQYGAPGWVAVTGDWTGAGESGIGVFDPKTATWYLRNESNAGAPDAGKFQYGGPNWIPVVGNWTGSGKTGIGVFDPASGTFYVRNEASAGVADAGKFQYGAPGWVPVTGDWSGTGHTGIGVFNPHNAAWFLRNEVSAGAADAGQFQYGAPGWRPLAGDWTGAGHAGIGVFDPGTATFYLRTETSAGAPDAGKFQFGAAGSEAVAGKFPVVSAAVPAASPATTLLTLNLNPLDINLLGLEVQTSQITITVSAQPGQGDLLGNLLSDVGNLLNLHGVNTALNSVLGSVVTLLNSASLSVSGVNTSSGPLTTAASTTATSVLDLFVAPVHLNLLGALIDTSPIHLTITAHSGPGLVLGNVVTDLANLFNPPLPSTLTLDQINAALQNLLTELNGQLTGIPISPVTTPTLPAGTERILSLAVPPIDVNLLGLVLKTSEIRVNADAQTGNGDLLGNVLTTLLNTLGATPQNLTALSSNLNALLADVVGVLNAASVILPSNTLSTLDQVLQSLAAPNLINATGIATAPIVNLSIASSDGTTPPVDVNLLGLIVTTSNIQAQIDAQTGNGQILGNLLYNVANLLNPGGSLSLLTILNALGL